MGLGVDYRTPRGDGHALALFGRKRLEADLEGEAPQRRLVEIIEEVGGADEDAGIALHASVDENLPVIRK